MLLKQVMNMNTVLFLQSCPRQLEYNIVLLYKPLIENSQLIKLGLVAYIEISVFWNRWKISSTLSKLSWVFNVVSCMNIAWTFSVSLSVYCPSNTVVIFIKQSLPWPNSSTLTFLYHWLYHSLFCVQCK